MFPHLHQEEKRYNYLKGSLQLITKPLAKKLVLFSLKDKFKPGEPLLLHDEPIFNKETIVGYTTSANFSFFYKKNICLAYIDGKIRDNDELFIEVEEKKYSSEVMWSEVEIIKNFSSEVKLMPQVNVSSFSSNISLSSSTGFPMKCW